MPPYVPKITAVIYQDRFKKELKALKPDLLAAAKSAIEDLYKVPIPASRRLHCVDRDSRPKVFTIDVLPNKSYKISLEIDGEQATLRRVATHKEIDRLP